MPEYPGDCLTAPFEFRLKDGSRCRIRPLDANDRELILGCFEGLSPESRRLRFLGAKTRLSESDLSFLTGADGRDHLALGAIRLDARGREADLLGAARCIRLGSDADTSELAMAVIDKAQGLGLGKTLLKQLVEVARRQGIRRFRCEVLAANQGMRALAGGPDSRVRWLEDGVLEYDYPFPEVEARAETPRPFLVDPFLVDPLLVARLSGETWTAVLEQGLKGSFVLGKRWLGFWLDRRPFGWPASPEPIGPEPGSDSGPVSRIAAQAG